MNQHVLKHPDGGWGVYKGGSDRPTRIFAKRAEAIKEGRGYARRQKVALYIHERGGKFSKVINFFDRCLTELDVGACNRQ